MFKLSYEDKIEIHKKKKQRFLKISLTKEYRVNISVIDCIYRIIENMDMMYLELIEISIIHHIKKNK